MLIPLLYAMCTVEHRNVGQLDTVDALSLFFCDTHTKLINYGQLKEYMTFCASLVASASTHKL